MNEMPMLAKSAYASTAYGGEDFTPMGQLQRRVDAINESYNGLGLGLGVKSGAIKQFSNKEPQVTTRIVKVFIVDTNENIPLEKRVIYSSDEKLTDLTDQELFFEANPAAMLAQHNELRAKTIDKKASERANKDVFLEPARIRDLKMVVVDVAAF